MTTQAKPKFITFTGADDSTSGRQMWLLQEQYPIEWGILFSPKRQGAGRYPSLGYIASLVDDYDMYYAAHLCGGDSRDLIAKGETEHDALLNAYFHRAQINTADPTVDPKKIQAWAAALHLKPILQCRGAFPEDTAVQWLFDASGGRGISPLRWPQSTRGVLTGFAGGLNPGNVAQAVEQIGATTDNYWIDMETGVRDANDRFDLSLCRQVCEAVYG